LSGRPGQKPRKGVQIFKIRRGFPGWGERKKKKISTDDLGSGFLGERGRISGAKGKRGTGTRERGGRGGVVNFRRRIDREKISKH